MNTEPSPAPDVRLGSLPFPSLSISLGLFPFFVIQLAAGAGSCPQIESHISPNLPSNFPSPPHLLVNTDKTNETHPSTPRCKYHPRASSRENTQTAPFRFVLVFPGNIKPPPPPGAERVKNEHATKILQLQVPTNRDESTMITLSTFLFLVTSLPSTVPEQNILFSYPSPGSFNSSRHACHSTYSPPPLSRSAGVTAHLVVISWF